MAEHVHLPRRAGKTVRLMEIAGEHLSQRIIYISPGLHRPPFPPNVEGFSTYGMYKWRGTAGYKYLLDDFDLCRKDDALRLVEGIRTADDILAVSYIEETPFTMCIPSQYDDYVRFLNTWENYKKDLIND